MKFAGFTPEQKHKVVQTMGYKGKVDNTEMDKFIKSTQGNSSAYDMAMQAAENAVGGIKKMAEGGAVTTATTTADPGMVGILTKTPEELAEEEKKANEEKNKAISDMSYKAVSDPKSMASKVSAVKMTEDPNEILDESKGQVGDVTTQATATGVTSSQATPSSELTPETISASAVADKTQDELDKVTAAQGTVSDKAQVTAAKGYPTKITALGTEDIVQITDHTKVVPPPARKIEEGEMISGSAVDMAAVKEATDIQAATADPSKKATVQGQL